MRSEATTPEAYIAGIPEDRRAVVEKLRALVFEAVPGATEHIQYGMLGYAIGGRAFASLASQKNYVAFYLMDLYTQPGLREKHAAALSKLDVGKSCIRFQPKAELPLDTFRAILSVAPTAVVTRGTMAPAAAKPARKTSADPKRPTSTKASKSR